MKRFSGTMGTAVCFLVALGVFGATAGARAAETVEAIPLNYIDAREAASVIDALYGNEVRAVPFTPTNTLLVNLSPAGSEAPARASVPGRVRALPGLSGPRPPMPAQPWPGQPTQFGQTAPPASPAPPSPEPAYPPPQTSEAPPTP